MRAGTEEAIAERNGFDAKGVEYFIYNIYSRIWQVMLYMLHCVTSDNICSCGNCSRSEKKAKQKNKKYQKRVCSNGEIHP